MNLQLSSLKAELIKLRHSRIVWVTFVAFAIAPCMGGVFMIILQNPEAIAQASMLNAKAQMLGFSTNWHSYLGLLTQAIGVGGVLIFGFVASWLFGREYSDGTAKDLLALPSSRASILHAKFVVYCGWCLALAISNLLVGFLIGILLKIEPATGIEIYGQLKEYFITTILTILPGTLIAFFAVWGKGYLAPLGFVAVTLVLSQILAAIGYGNYFPWSIPGLFSGLGGEYKLQLNLFSYAILLSTGIAGYVATICYWKYADQMD